MLKKIMHFFILMGLKDQSALWASDLLAAFHLVNYSVLGPTQYGGPASENTIAENNNMALWGVGHAVLIQVVNNFFLSSILTCLFSAVLEVLLILAVENIIFSNICVAFTDT